MVDQASLGFARSAAKRRATFCKLRTESVPGCLLEVRSHPRAKAAKNLPCHLWCFCDPNRGKPRQQKRHGRFRLLYCGIAPGRLVTGLIDQRPESDGSRTTYRRDERVGGTVVAHSNAAPVL